VNLYSYSSESHTFKGARWAALRFALGGMFIGVILISAFIQLDHSIGITRGARSAHALAMENDVLRQQLSVIVPRLSSLEVQAMQLDERANELHMLLDRQTIVGDRVTRVTNAPQKPMPRSLNLAAASSGH
jgi:hypothetical protein